MKENPSPSKKELILQICEEKGFTVIHREEIELINRALSERLGPRGGATPSYIANVLIEAGKDVRYRDIMVKRRADDRYGDLFEGVLSFKNLEASEGSLREIDRLYHKFKAEGDKVGVARTELLATTGWRRASVMAKNRKLAPSIRLEKEEIACWFELWSENPEVFWDWLELRKRSQKFLKQFGDLSDSDGSYE